MTQQGSGARDELPRGLARRRHRDADVLHELVPKAIHVAVLVNPANAVNTETTLREVREAAPAAAQERVSVSGEFRLALEPYGAWHHNGRFGDVWVATGHQKNWRPYTAGYWIYTEVYGWYWIEDLEEADWGWIAYHYGRGYFDADDGWIWIPGDEWSPGWVGWRFGEQIIGWAPLAPAEAVVDVEEHPEFWVFVLGPDFGAPRLDRALLPPQEAATYLQRAAVVNRTVELRDRRFAVNPGIPPIYVAAALGKTLQAFDVRPRVFAGTVNLPGAMQIGADDLRRQRQQDNQSRRPGARIFVQPSGTLISPVVARALPAPQPLARGEPGHLGDSPPLAARGPAPPTTDGRAPAEPSQQPNGRSEGSASPKRRNLSITRY